MGVSREDAGLTVRLPSPAASLKKLLKKLLTSTFNINH